jgi:hypothetical protein
MSTDNLKKAGWTSGCISSTDHNGRQFFSFSANAAAQGQGVPDGGSAVALLGIGLGVIEFIRRKVRLRA